MVTMDGRRRPKTEKWLAAMRNRGPVSPEALARMRAPEYLERKRFSSTHHGYTDSRTYASWQSMKARCTNPNRREYPWYGGRGVSFDPRWSRFESFLEDMGERPVNTTLDRVDSDGNYTKDNCRWAPWSVQVANTRQRNQFSGLPLPERSGCSEPGCKNLARRLRGPGLCGWHTTKAYRIRHGLM